MNYSRTIYENDTVQDAAQILNHLDQGIYDLCRNMNGEVVWENNSPTTTFSAQTVTITSEETVQFYEIIFSNTNAAGSTTNNNVATTGKIPMGKNTTMAIAYHGSIKSRYVEVSQNASTGEVTLAFQNGYSGTSAGSGNIIPLQIKFHY